MPCVRLTIEYDGAAFHGYQRQPGLKTVESELVRALGVVLREPEVRLRAAGRTDSGVHARGQVVNFRTAGTPDLERLKLAVSSILRHELAVVSAEIVSDDFDARRDAISKQYSYLIVNRATPLVLERKAWRIGGELDAERMAREARSFLGTHDFTSFRGAGCEAESPRRSIDECELLRSGETVTFRVVGRSFLKHMVRNMIGTLADIGRGTLQSSIADVLAARDRSAAGVTAPGEGLTLDWVRYCPRFAAPPASAGRSRT